MKTKFFLTLLFVFFLLRVFAVPQIYHQDEYKWAVLASPSAGFNLASEHPPLVILLYRAAGVLFGFDHLRLLPLLFAVLSLFLAYRLAERLYGVRVARFVAAILSLSVYYIIAGVQIDIDGALLPFFTLAAFVSYYKIDFSALSHSKNRAPIVLLFLSLLGGLLVKLSFVLVIAVLLTEFLLEHHFTKKNVFYAGGMAAAAGVGAAAAILALDFFFGVSNPTEFLTHASGIPLGNFAGRNYFQVLFLSVKAVVLASPLLLGGYLFFLRNRARFHEFRLWFVFLLYHFIFYFVIFDFSNRTMERYLMFFILPSAFITGAFMSEAYEKSDKKIFVRGCVWGTGIFAVVSFFLFSLPYDILPLNPKSAFLSHLAHLDFQFLIPITGGSGPIGFYLLVSFILFSFSLTLGALLAYLFLKKEKSRTIALGIFLAASLCYNLALTEEYLFGGVYGSPDRVARALVSDVVTNKKISGVITYYDIAGYELNASGKYTRRFYTDPMFEKTNRPKFASYDGTYMVLDFPAIDKTSVYWKYLATCATTKELHDKTIAGYLFDCKNGNRDLFR